MTHVKAQNDLVYFSGCQCHVVHNPSAAAAIRNATGFDVYYCLITLQNTNHYWRNTQNFAIKTIERYSNMSARDGYFVSEEHEGNARFQRLNQAFSDPMTEIYLLFNQSALQIFIKAVFH